MSRDSSNSRVLRAAGREGADQRRALTRLAVLGACLLVLVGASMPALASGVPDLSKLPKYQTPLPYAGIRNWHVTQTLGPTGARGWIYGHRGNTAESREILVKSVEPGSPADGILHPYDIIVGTRAPEGDSDTSPRLREFDTDARLSMARAITHAEGTLGMGKLDLLRWRDGVTEEVTIILPVMGDYSPTAPFDCPKSQRIVDNAAAFLADRMPARGYGGFGGPLHALFLYATGDDRYLDHVRRNACNMGPNHTMSEAGHETWRWGYGNLFLCEYYLATGDKRVLGSIQDYCDGLARGQCNPGTWCHGGVKNRMPGGYGSLNQAGLVCFLSLVLSRQCGADVDEFALQSSIEFYGGYAGRGGIPYGDHMADIDSACNGKNGSAAVAFAVLGADKASKWFASLACSSNLAAFEGGHTGNFFNQVWTPLGASWRGRANYQRFWKRFNSYRDLARRHDGAFIVQPLPDTRESDMSATNYIAKGPMWSTGGYALSYLARNNALGILGRRRSVFAEGAPGELDGALALYNSKRFEECISSSDALTASIDPTVRMMALQLRSAAQRNINSIGLALEDMRKGLACGDLYKLKQQLQGIESIVDRDDERLKEFRDAVDSPDNAEIIQTGRQYHRLRSMYGKSNIRGFEVFASGVSSSRRWRDEMKAIAEQGDTGYARLAQSHLAAAPPAPWEHDMPLVPRASEEPRRGKLVPDTKAKCWRIAPKGSTPDQDWREPSFDDSDWQRVSLPAGEIKVETTRLLRGTFNIKDALVLRELSIDFVLKGGMKAYLNGRLIMDITCGDEYGAIDSATVILKPATLELLRDGENCIAVVVAPKPGRPFNLLFKGMLKE